ncbi:bifunctional metallophosphatase/5'-nucleotidase [Jeotgalibacillus haloalkalitolerans]|uniref:Bifunctional UDP-sugar hydrolase/5'-nucleotidase n=1 Tax=Jeotgalibacillus haloalkalitolerans TaxID=3104292 RepID=A0ABU5KNV6_9BACL|nr:bifunctional UDP-sugar hydrolase/5'-nucleotidase [Jeotgalibacillus sp. HH7-29]MDZ5712942.1 bifunctional UDP-sugar hydrolase/5'-nucleotidase [Jeotgalibacillus sp. HH7-29]
MANDHVQLTILQTSDIHGHVRSTSHWGTDDTHGMARLSSLIKKIRQNDPDLLLLDTGDMLKGSPLTYHYAKYNDHMPNPMISIMNHLEYDCAAIGEYDFDYGLPFLSRAVGRSFFPWLAANVVHKTTKEPYFGFPYTVKTVNGVKVAILGISATRKNGEEPFVFKDILFEDAYVAAKRWVGFIHETESPDLVVVNYHGGFNGASSRSIDQGEAICSIDGIDILLTGREHEKISEIKNGKFVMQSGGYGEVLGEVKVSLSGFGSSFKIEAIEGLFHSARETEPDAEIEKLIHFQELETINWSLREKVPDHFKAAKSKDQTVNDWLKKMRLKDYIDFF